MSSNINEDINQQICKFFKLNEDIHVISHRRQLGKKLHCDNYRSYGRDEYSDDSSDHDEKRIPERQKIKDTSNYKSSYKTWFCKCLFCITAVGLIILLMKYLVPLSRSEHKRKLNLQSEIVTLREKYPTQHKDLWFNILMTINSTEPRVHAFILLYRDNGDVAESIAKDFAKILNKLFEMNDELVIYESNKEMEHGEALTHYSKKIKEKKHLIVLQLHRLIGEEARMFHYLCDEINGPVKPSYLIFTLKELPDKDIHTRDTKLLSRAGNTLRNAWKNLKENELHPLISRIVRIVAEVQSESPINL